MLLNAHTHFSLNYGILSPEELVNEVVRGGHRMFAITDINNTSACMDVLRLLNERHSAESQAPALNPTTDNRLLPTALLGIDFRNGAQQRYVGLAKNMSGFRELNEHLSTHLHQGFSFDDRAPAFDHAFVVYPWEQHPASLRENEFVGIRADQLARLKFSASHTPQEKLVMLHSATFRNKRDHNAHRLLRAIGNNALLSQLPPNEQANERDRFITAEDLHWLYADHPNIIQNTERLLEQCNAQFEFGGNRNKAIWSSSLVEDHELLIREAKEGLQYRYPNGASNEVLQRMDKELNMIRDLGFCSYFLINWDMVRYAHHKGYYYVGRGSGANSLVAYLLRITDVDPVELDLYFERFINPHRSKPPDFDIDFSWTDRDDVTNYLFERYGRDRTALLGTYTTFKQRSVFRELGKVFGLPAAEITRLQQDPDPSRADTYGQAVLRYAPLIGGKPNNLSVHASGILISEAPINAYCGTFLPPKGYPTTQFDMQVAEDIGLHKFDILSQRGLGKIKDSLGIIEQNKGEVVDIHDVPRFKQDLKIKELLKVGDTIGCFYVESPAMRSLLTKLEADDYLRLVAASSIIRPGVAKSGMMREYILRYRDPKRREKAREELPEFYDILHETYGVMVYQEDVIKVAHFFAGLTLAEADILRRGMSWRYKQRNEFKAVEGKFFSNCAKKGYDPGMVKRVWTQIESFANFAFAKGHSASYAVESYQALFLKAHYPLEYLVATLNNGGGFYRPELYLHEARLHGATVEPPCVNTSDLLNNLQGNTIYLGLYMIRGMEVDVLRAIVLERSVHGRFNGLRDLLDRVAIPLEQLCLLIRIGALRFTGKPKKELLWDAHFLLSKDKRSRPSANLFQVDTKEFELPPLWHHELEQAFDERELLGFPLCDPFSLLQDELPSKLTVADLRNMQGQEVNIVGYLIHRKLTQTHSKASMSFGTLLDLDGQWLDTVQFPQVDARYQFTGRGCYLITGKVSEEFGFLAVETTRIERLPERSMEAKNTRLRSTETYYHKPTTKLSKAHADRRDS